MQYHSQEQPKTTKDLTIFKWILVQRTSILHQCSLGNWISPSTLYIIHTRFYGRSFFLSPAMHSSWNRGARDSAIPAIAMSLSLGLVMLHYPKLSTTSAQNSDPLLSSRHFLRLVESSMPSISVQQSSLLGITPVWLSQAWSIRHSQNNWGPKWSVRGLSILS